MPRHGRPCWFQHEGWGHKNVSTKEKRTRVFIMGNISSADSTRRLEDEFFTPSDMIGRDIIVEKEKYEGTIELPNKAKAKLSVTLKEQNVPLKDLDDKLLYALKESSKVRNIRTYKIVQVKQVSKSMTWLDTLISPFVNNTYDNNKQYNINDEVYYNNNVWKSKQKQKGNKPTLNNDNWE